MYHFFTISARTLNTKETSHRYAQYYRCAAQRLMQALGAFGNIITNRNDAWYRQHVPVAMRSLLSVIGGTEIEDALSPILRKHLAAS